MITSFVDLCTHVFVLVDDLYRQVVAPHDHRPGPRSVFTDSEVITVTLIAELLGKDTEAPFLAWLRKNHLALFPLLPERSRFNRRRRQLPEATNRIRGALMERLVRHLAPEEADLCVIASLPVPVVGFQHAQGAHRWWGEATFGYVAVQRLTIYGFKLHLLITHSGLILDFVLALAHYSDGAFTEQLLADKRQLATLGDKAYLNEPLHAWLAEHNAVIVLTPKRTNQRQQHPPLLTKAITHFRQAIETVNSQLAHQFGVERNWAKTMFGLAARIQAKLAAHTIGVYLNCLFGQPLLALANFMTL